MYRLGQISIGAPGGDAKLLDEPNVWIAGAGIGAAAASRFLAKKPTLGKTLLSAAAGMTVGFLGWATVWLPYRLKA